jgi:hypothetical protein
MWNTNSSFSFWWSYSYTATEEYNGTSWTAGGVLNTARNLGTAGTQTAALAFGGRIPPATGATEEYDGSTWTTILQWKFKTARYNLAGAGTSTSRISFWWIHNSQCYKATEEWTGAGAAVTKTITVS